VHAICAVVTEEFLAHQQAVGNDLGTPRPEWGFPGLHPGDRWCVVAARWRQAEQDGVAAPVVLEILRAYSVDVPSDPGALGWPARTGADAADGRKSGQIGRKAYIGGDERPLEAARPRAARGRSGMDFRG
jgi:uncharacterized protein DUF2237